MIFANQIYVLKGDSRKGSPDLDYYLLKHEFLHFFLQKKGGVPIPEPPPVSAMH